MTIKWIALGVCLLVAGNALAQNQTYTVKAGDTLSQIAGKFNADKKAIVYANNLQNAHKLRLGQKLVIPTTSTEKALNKPNPVGDYQVRPGDNDVKIAHQFGITPHELRAANMGTNWTRLQIGQPLVIPSTKNWFANMSSRAISEAKTSQAAANVGQFKLASSIKPAPRPATVPKTYTVRKGENDWIIAKRVGIKPSELRSLNPGVKWTNLKIGLVLRLPGTKTVAPSNAAVATGEPSLPRLRSRYAVLTGSGVTARRGPSTRFPSVVQVDKGTRVLVLDREGSWYKLRFPKGTEAWVRGDFLAPTSAPQTYAKSSTKRKTVVASKTSKGSRKKSAYVASNSRPSSQATRNRRQSASNSGKPLAYASNGNGGLLDKAESFLGVRYRYGAASRSATDCSGFTTQVFKSQGVKLPRTAAQQSSRGQKVSKGELKAGDLVFFNTRGSRVSHVGIYKGNGKFIHASSGKGRVMESSLNEGYYQRRFAGARRVISTKPSTSMKKEEPKPKKEEPKPAPVEKIEEPPVSPPPSN